MCLPGASLLALLALTASSLTPISAAATPRIRAGAAVADITPPVGTPMFAYTARSGIANPPRALEILADPDENLHAKTFEPSDGIHTRVRAAALVIESGRERFALVSADLGGLPYALVQAVERRIKGTGIEGERLLVSATHTHSSTGPIWPADSAGYAALGGDLFDPRIFELTAEALAEAVREATGRLEPARIGVGTAPVPDASSNRSFEAFGRNEDVPRAEGEALRASINRNVTAVRVDAAGGTPLGVWSSFAVHQTSFGDENLLFSGDNAATTQRLVEERLAEAGRGRRTNGASPVHVWVNGAEGDVSPAGSPDVRDGEPLQYVPNDYASANLVGARVAQGVLRAWRDAGERLRDRLPLAGERTFLAFDGSQADGEPVGPLAVLGAGGIVAPDGFCAPVEGFAGPGQGQKFPLLAGAGLVPSVASVSLLRIGRVAIAAFPSEITTQMGRRIAHAIVASSRGGLEDSVIAGLTNGYLSYTATPEEYDACHYEGSFTLFGRRQGARYQEAALGLLPSVLNLPGDPPPRAPEPPPTGFGAPPLPPLEATPGAGAVVAQPARSARRMERVSFSWKGGDPGVDAARGRPFVRLQYLGGGGWRTVGTEDGPEDITVWDDDARAWTETWQFGQCAPLGRYRFLIRGLAAPSALRDLDRYRVVSRSFRLRRTDPLSPIDARIDGRIARVRLAYPDPGVDALLALPRRVRSGEAAVTVQTPGGGRRRVDAALDDERLAFLARMPRGSKIVGIDARDRCGNST